MQSELLLGRDAEREALDRLLADAGGGKSHVLVLRGEAGVGKSALLRYLSASAPGWCVLSAVGVESEMELAYSGLHQLCAPLLDGVGWLPGPQRTALATVFGRSAGPAPDRFLVGLATLSLLADAAERQPLLVLVDDAQWLDQATAGILGFVARRLLAERVALVFAARPSTGDDVLPGLPDRQLSGLTEADARALLEHGLPGPLDERVRDSLIAESRGNPLALLELPRTWRASELAGGFGLPGSQLAGKIEQSYIRRLTDLPQQAQLLVLAAAAEPLGDPILLHSAAQKLGVDFHAVTPAVDTGLLEIGGRVQFAHPLVRSAAYRSASATDRLRVHQALADATDVSTDPDRRAWHRARAAAGPDEEVAAELERSAGRARSRGGLAAAAAFLTRATELTPDRTTRVRRALDAAFANVEAAAIGTARTLLATAAGGPADEWQQARIDLLRAQLAYVSSRGKEATPLLLAAANRLEPLDPGLARETYLDALVAALIGAQLNDAVGPAEVANAARKAQGKPETPGDLLLDAFTALADDYERAAPLSRTALAALISQDLPEPRLRWLWEGTLLAMELWDDESWHLLTERHLRLARAAGALHELTFMLGGRALLLASCGELTAAAELSDENESVQEVTGISSAPYGALSVAAWRGQNREARALLDESLRMAVSTGEGTGVAVSESLTRCCATAWAPTTRHARPPSGLPSHRRRSASCTARCPS